jgi:hypothetical protein
LNGQILALTKPNLVPEIAKWPMSGIFLLGIMFKKNASKDNIRVSTWMNCIASKLWSKKENPRG